MIKPSKQILLLIGVRINKQETSLLENAHCNYCPKLFEDFGTCKKWFWTYIKIEKRITAPLNDGGTTYTKAKQKAQILNK